MTSFQAFLLGAMVAWTPCLIMLAFILRDARPVERDQEVPGCEPWSPRHREIMILRNILRDPNPSPLATHGLPGDDGKAASASIDNAHRCRGGD